MKWRARLYIGSLERAGGCESTCEATLARSLFLLDSVGLGSLN